MLLDINSSLSRVIEALRKRITFGENIQAIEMIIADTGPADTEFSVNHMLGKIPRLYLYNCNVGGVVYDSRRADWTQSAMYLKCTQPNATLVLTIT